MNRSWLEELEARLEEQLEGFLRANPRQEELLAEQEARERQLSLRQERLELQQRAEAKRQGLLELVQEIRLWQQRCEKARAAGAADLAMKAEAHLAALMEQGRRDWQTLTDLGQRFASVEAALDALNAPGDSARAAGGTPAGAKAPGQEPPSSGGERATARPTADPAAPRQPKRGAAASPANPSRQAAGPNKPPAGDPGSGTPLVDPAVDLEAAWHAFATQLELEELRRRVGS